MFDTIEKDGESLIQHGKLSDRIYLMKLNKSDYPAIIEKLEKLADKENYSKIVAKIPVWAEEEFKNQGYIKEAFIPGFYNGETDGLFYVKYCNEERKKTVDEKRKEIENNIKIAIERKNSIKSVPVDLSFEFRKLNENDAAQLVEVYKVVFETYPFPIHEEDYIKQTMKENIIYFGAFEGEKLVAASSAEMDEKSSNCEMTDFATLPEYRGKKLGLILLAKMEEEMSKMGIKTLYTIARSISAGMNIIFSKMGYEYTGTLFNNTNISGKIESMNVWYKSC